MSTFRLIPPHLCSCITVKNLIYIDRHLEDPHVDGRLPLMHLKDLRRGWKGRFPLPCRGPPSSSGITKKFSFQKYGMTLNIICLSIFDVMFIKVNLPANGGRSPQQVVKVWKFSNSDITNKFFVQKYRIVQIFICLSPFGAI